jgi:hypothetical protein
MQDGRIRGKYKGILDMLMSNISYAMGVIMIFYALFSAAVDMKSKDMVDVVLINIVPIVFGILIIMDRHRSLFFTVGLYAVAIGFSRFVQYVPLVLTKEPFSTIIGLVLVYMAVNLMYHGVRFLRGNSRAITWVIVGTMFFILLEVALIVAYVVGSEGEITLNADIADIIVKLFMLLTYIALVSSAPVRKSTNLERLNSELIAFRLNTGTGFDFSLDTDSAKALADFFRGDVDESRVTVRDQGPVYRGITLPFRDKYESGTLFLQRWEGPEGPVYLSLCEHEEGSVLGIDTRRIEEVTESGNLVILRYSDSKTGIFRVRGLKEDDRPLFTDSEGAA